MADSKAWHQQEWPHHGFTTPLLSAASVYAVGGVLADAHVQPWHVGLAGGVGTLAATFASLVHHARLGTASYVAAAAGAASGWLTWAAGSTPFSETGLISAAACYAALAPIYPLTRWAQQREADRDEATRREYERRARADKWPALLASVGFRGMDLVEAPTETRAGYVLRMLLPPNGSVLFSTLRSSTEKLEVAAELQAGSVRIERGSHAREVLIHVSVRDILAEVMPLPDDHSPLSINDPLPFATGEDGSTTSVSWVGKRAQIVGMSGAGKSVTSAVLINQWTRCTDLVVWMLDLKGGRTARPWLTPWLEKRVSVDHRGREHLCGRPVFDWVATTPEEAMRMLNAAVRVIKYRAAAGRGSKVRPTRAMPALMIVGEELAEIAGNYKAAESITTVDKQGRSEAVNLVKIIQRGTVPNTGGGEAKSQTNLTIGLGMSTQAEAMYVFPDDWQSLNLAKLAHAGSLYMKDGRDARPIPSRSWFIDDEDEAVVPELAARNTYARPDLDAGSAAAAGEDYARRWEYERCSHLLAVGAAASSATPTEPAAPASPSSSATGSAPRRPASDSGPGDPPKKTYESLIPPPPGTGPKWVDGRGNPIRRPDSAIDFDTEFERLAANLASGADGDGELAADHPVRAAMLNMIAAAGAEGLSPGVIHEQLKTRGFKVHRSTVMRWLADDVAKGVLVQPHGQGRYVIARPTGRNPQEGNR